VAVSWRNRRQVEGAFEPETRDHHGEQGVEMEFQKHVLILAMIEALSAQGARCGKTAVVKGLLLAESAGLLEPRFRFFLYKHGPYSTEVLDDVERMVSYDAVAVEPGLDGYGVLLKPAKMASYVKQQSPLSDEARAVIDRVCGFIRQRNVLHLERLATAAWIRTREAIDDPDDVAQRLHALKPHISLEAAREADRQVADFLRS
jgi:hypothetical protein